MEENLTIKEKVLRFVESKGTARFTDIQEFIVDMKHGEGTYKSGVEKVTEKVWNWNTNSYVERKITRNKYRGVHSGSINGYLSYGGTGHLVKVKDGFTVKRNEK